MAPRSSQNHPRPFAPHQDLTYHFFPEQIANVSRIMKNSLPGGAKVSKEAKECVQESVSEFISFIVSLTPSRAPSWYSTLVAARVLMKAGVIDE